MRNELVKKFVKRLSLLALIVSVGVLTVFASDSCRKSETDCQNESCLKSDSYPEISGQKDGDKGWTILFDGTSTDQWRGIHKDSFPDSGWVVKDGILVFDPPKKRAGDIITKQEYSDFEFELEFKITEGANSGIKYFVVEEATSGTAALGLEYQILDDARHPDAKHGKDGNRTVGSLYDLITADKNKKVNPPGQWNKVRIVSRGQHVEHWLNGMKVLEYERGGDAFKKIVAGSKYKDKKDFGLAPKGHIVLQDHHNKVYYRNIRIRELK